MKQPLKWKPAILGGTVLVLCLGMASASPRQEEALLLRLQTPAQDSRVQVSPGSVVGDDIRLVRDEAAVRGQVFGRSVFLHFRASGVEGSVGSQPARLTWGDAEGTLRLEGSLVGGPVGLELSPERLTGSVGPCVYDLEFLDEAYVGVRACGAGDLQRVSVSLTSSFPPRRTPMLAMALGLLLGL